MIFLLFVVLISVLFLQTLSPRCSEHLDKLEATKRKQEDQDGGPVAKKATTLSLAPFYTKLITTSVDVVKPENDTVFIAMRTDKVVDVLQGLLKHGFLSVPVLQKSGNKYYGFVDSADIVQFIVDHCGELDDKIDFWKIVEEQEKLRDATVNDVLRYPLTRDNPFHPIHRGCTLFSAFEALAREKGLHRVPIVNSERKITNMITASALLRFVHKHADLLAPVADLAVEKMRFRSEGVFTVSEDDNALAAFKLLREKHLTGCGVVDATGKLVGALSIKDVRTLGYDGRNLHRLGMTVKNFLRHVKQDHSGSDERPRRMVTVKPGATLISIIEKLVEFNLHRLFLVDEAHKPVSVISIIDVLRELLP